MSSDGPAPTEDAAKKSPETELAEVLKAKLPEAPIPAEQLADILAQILSVEIRQITRFQGPLPPPGMLSEYRDVDPGFAERIFKMAEQEQQFRHEMNRERMRLEGRSITHRAGQNYLAQALAGTATLLAIGGGIYLLATGHQAEGLGAIITPIAGLVVAFVAGKVASIFGKRSQEDGDDDTDDADDSE